MVLALALVLLTAWRISAREALGLDLHYDEAQYFAWSLDPAFGYFSKPPMIAWVIAASSGVCGTGEACLRAPSAFGFLVASFMVFAIARHLATPSVALVAGLVFALSPLTSFYSWFITTDSLLLMFWSAALYAFIRAVEARGSTRWWITTGLFAGLGLLSKYTMGIFAISALGFLFFDVRARKQLQHRGPWLGVAIATVLFAPNMIWNAMHRFATLEHTAGIAQVDRAGIAPASMLRFIAEQFGVFGPLTTIAFIAALGAWSLRDRPASARDFLDALAVEWPRARVIRMLAWFALPFLLVIGTQALFARALANWAACTYIAASVLAALWLCERTSIRTTVVALAVNFLAAALMYHHPFVLGLIGVKLGEARDPLVQVRGWKPLGEQVGRLLETRRARLVSVDRRVMSEMIYYAGPRAHDALMFNPSRVVDNQYRLMRDVERTPNGPFLYVTSEPDPAMLARDFESVEALPPLSSAPCDGCTRTLHVYALGRFVGYR